MRWRRLALVFLVAGCDQILGVNDITLGDGGTQPGGDGGGGGSACIKGAGPSDSLIQPCFATLPTGDITLSSAINTDSDARCSMQHQAMSGPDVCVISAATITVNGTVRATGLHPLVIAATQAITVNGTLDVRGLTGQGAPAGADQSPCLPTGDGIYNTTNPGGGGGAGFGGAGAQGGGGNLGGNGGPKDAQPVYVRGGCSGGTGASQTQPPTGVAGQGGGGVYLIADVSIEVSTGAVIEASGGGGGGSVYGGGGGASGGMIGIDSPCVEVDGDVIANGGGGGAGGSNGVVGNPGSTGTLTTAAGGSGNGIAGDGGAGGIGATGPMAGTQIMNCQVAPCGSGGGGGGVGVVWMNYIGALVTGNVVPDSIP